MDMWKPFLKSTNKKAPQAAILFDKFHILKHLGDALDKVRKQEYATLDGENASSSKGRSMHSFPTRRTWRATLEKTLRFCWLPTSGSIPPTC
jgi:transposase